MCRLKQAGSCRAERKVMKRNWRPPEAGEWMRVVGMGFSRPIYMITEPLRRIGPTLHLVWATVLRVLPLEWSLTMTKYYLFHAFYSDPNYLLQDCLLNFVKIIQEDQQAQQCFRVIRKKILKTSLTFSPHLHWECLQK